MHEKKDILTLIDADYHAQFDEWKKSRLGLLQSIGSTLTTFDEIELQSIFEAWDNSIKVALQTDKIKPQLTGLMAFSIFQHFQENFDQIKQPISLVYSLIWNKNVNVYKAAIQCIIWICKESQDKSFLFQDPVSLAFDHICTKKLKVYENALYLIRKAQKYIPTYVSHLILNQYQTLFPFSYSDNPILQDNASHIIKLFLLNCSKRIHHHFFQQFFNNI